MKLATTLYEAISRFLGSLTERIEKDGDKLIFVPIIIYITIFSAYTCYQHYVFKTYAWDLGILTQSLWTTLNSGKILYSTLEVPYGNPSGNFIGVHFSPILFLLLPIYRLFQSPQTLLVFQSFILAIAALPLYWLARDKLDSKLYGIAFATAYLLNPALHGVNTFDFHLEIFTPAFLLFAFYYLEKGKWFKALPFIILELMTLEFAPILVFFLGLYFLLKHMREYRSAEKSRVAWAKRLIVPTAIMLISILSLYLAFYTIATVNPLKIGGPYRTWGYWGNNVSEVVSNIVRNPTDAIIVLLTPIEKSYFLIFLFSSVLLLPILAPPELMMAVPWLLASLFTDYQPYYSPVYQYTVLALGQLYIAAIFGFKKLFSSKNQKEDKRSSRSKTIALLLIVNAFLFLAISPLGIPAFTARSLRPYSISTEAGLHHVNELNRILDLVPPDASIATIQDIFPHVCQRLHAYFLKWPLDYKVEYILIDVKSPTFTWNVQGDAPDIITVRLLKNKTYGILASSDGILLLQRGYVGPLEYFTPQIDVFNYNQLISTSGKLEWDYASTSGKIIASNPIGLPGIVWFGPYKYLVPGKYQAIFRLRTSNETCQFLLEVTSKQGSNEILQRIVNGTEFRSMGNWQDFLVYFKLDEITNLEFRGASLSNSSQFALDYVRVEQLGS